MRLSSALALAVLLLAGCSSSTPAPVAPPTTAAPSAVVAPPAPSQAAAPTPAETAQAVLQPPGPAITSGEFYDAARAIEADANRLDAARLSQWFDMEALATATLKNLTVSNKARQGLIDGMSGKAGGQSIGAQIIAEMQRGREYRLLRVHNRRGQPFALFRLAGNDGLNYQDLVLAKNQQGEIRVVDVQIWVTGERMSQTIRRLMLPVIAQENRSILQKLMKSESEYVQNLPKIQRMQTAMVARDGQSVLSIYRSLPASLREEKSMMTMRAMAASLAEDTAENIAAYEDYKRLFPGDPAMDMVGLDALFLSKKTAEALAAIDRIDRSVGGDLYLNAMRASVGADTQDFEAAEALFLKAMQDPTAPQAIYWQVIEVSMKKGRYDKTLQYLVEVERKYPLEMGDLSTVDAYAGFVKSPQYQEWLKRKKPR
jgi:tetratricopeptide (TPR) repeat protein